MSILPPEPHLYPEYLFDATEQQAVPARKWWVLHTRPRQEKCLARRLFHIRIPFYLPLVWQSHPGRAARSYIPAFPGYLFLFGDGHERIVSLSTNRVVRTLEVIAQDDLWNDLHQVYRLIGSGQSLCPDQRLEPGTRVEIKSGPLTGLRGRVVTAGAGRRFVVEVDFIQRGISVLLNDVRLQRID